MNAAVELANIFQEWARNNAISIYSARGKLSDDGPTIGYWADYQRVIELIIDLDYALDVIESKGKPRKRYDRLMVRIWQHAVLPNTGWNEQNKASLSVSEDDINLLSDLDELIQVHVPQANGMTEVARDIVLGLLEETRAAALDCFDLPQEIRTRLAYLIEQLGTLLDPAHDANPRTVQRTLDEMISILLRAVLAETNPEKKLNLFNLVSRFAQSTAESGSYDVMKALAANPVKEMLGLPSGEAN